MKKFFTLITLLIGVSTFAQGTFGPEGDLEPLGPYPIVKQRYIQGGLHVLEDTAILASYLRDSVMVFQKSNEKFYRWFGGTWIEIPTGGNLPYNLGETGDTLLTWGIQYLNGGKAFVSAYTNDWFQPQGLILGTTASGGLGPEIKFRGTWNFGSDQGHSGIDNFFFRFGSLDLMGGVDEKGNKNSNYLTIDTLGIAIGTPYANIADWDFARGLYYDPRYFSLGTGAALIDSLKKYPYAFRVSPDTLVKEWIAQSTPSPSIIDLSEGDTLAAFQLPYVVGGKQYITGRRPPNTFTGSQGIQFGDGSGQGTTFWTPDGMNFEALDPSGANVGQVRFKGSQNSFIVTSPSNVDLIDGRINSAGFSINMAVGQPSGFKGVFLGNAYSDLDSVRANKDGFTYLPQALVAELVSDSLSAYSPSFQNIEVGASGNDLPITAEPFIRLFWSNDRFGGALQERNGFIVKTKASKTDLISSKGYSLSVDPQSPDPLNPTASNYRQSLAGGVGVNVPLISESPSTWLFHEDRIKLVTGRTTVNRDTGWFYIDSTQTISKTALVNIEGDVKFRGTWKDHSGTQLSDGQTLVANGAVLEAKTVATTTNAQFQHDFPSILPGEYAEHSTAVTGAEIGKSIILTPSATAYGASTVNFHAYISATNTVVIRAANYGNAAIDPDNATFYLKIVD